MHHQSTQCCEACRSARRPCCKATRLPGAQLCAGWKPPLRKLHGWPSGNNESCSLLTLQRENYQTEYYLFLDVQFKRSHLNSSSLTFALKAFFSQDADQGQELGYLFQIQHSGVVEFDDGHGLLVIGTAATILPQTEAQHSVIHYSKRG